MQLAQLFWCGFGWGAHEQVLSLLVHREQRDLTQIAYANYFSRRMAMSGVMALLPLMTL